MIFFGGYVYGPLYSLNVISDGSDIPHLQTGGQDVLHRAAIEGQQQLQVQSVLPKVANSARLCSIWNELCCIIKVLVAYIVMYILSIMCDSQKSLVAISPPGKVHSAPCLVTVYKWWQSHTVAVVMQHRERKGETLERA